MKSSEFQVDYKRLARLKDKVRPYRNFAPRIYDLGFSVTPPFVPGGGKGQTIKPWGPYQSERMARQQVLDYSYAKQNYNYGIITGAVSGVVVLDTDDQFAEALVGKHCPPTPVQQRSGSGRGTHHVYRHPGYPVANCSKVSHQGTPYNLDVRGDGGLIVGPGCVHERTGGLYKEVEPWTQELLAEAPVFDPTWLQLDQKAKKPKVITPSSHPDVPLGRKQQLASEYLKTKQGSAGGMNPDNYALALAVELLWGFDLDDSALAVFQEWGDRGRRHADAEEGSWPWTEKELAHKLDSADGEEDNQGRAKGWRLNNNLEYVYGDQLDAIFKPKPDYKPDFNLFNELEGDDVAVEKEAKDIHEQLQAKPDISAIMGAAPELNQELDAFLNKSQRKWLTASDLWAYKSTRNELIPNFLISGTHTLFSAREKRGKTHWLINFISDWLAEGVVMNSFVDPVPIVYLDYEMGIDLFQKFYFSRLFPTPEHACFKNVEDHFRYYCRDGDRLPDYVTPKFLSELTADLPRGIIMMDTIRGANGANPNVKKIDNWENNPGAVGSVLRPITEWCHNSGWNVVSIHHNNKSDGFSGSTEFGAAVDNLWCFTAKGEGTGRTMEVVGRGTRGTYDFTFTDERYTYVPAGSSTAAQIEKWVIEQHKPGVNMTQRTVLDLRPAHLPVDKIREAHKRLVSNGQLVSGGYNLGYTVPK